MSTKRLALELGLVQKRKTKKGSSFKSKATQEFEFLIVLDFESTCWENGRQMSRQEIIEFPAVLLRLATGEILSEFQQYVMPVEQPILSEFCTNLTGINQDQVEAGVPLGACLSLFSSWIRKLCDQYQISFNTSIPGKHVTFATWSDWDLGVCLHYECNRKQLKKPEFFNQWIDIKITYKNFYQRKPQGLAGALKDLGIAFEGREHSGICDTRNTAVLISRMARDGCVLKITKSIAAAKPKVSSIKETAKKIFNQVKNVVLGKRPHVNNQEGRPQKYTKLDENSTAGTLGNKKDGTRELNQDDECVNFNLRLSGIAYEKSTDIDICPKRKLEDDTSDPTVSSKIQVKSKENLGKIHCKSVVDTARQSKSASDSAKPNGSIGNSRKPTECVIDSIKSSETIGNSARQSKGICNSVGPLKINFDTPSTSKSDPFKTPLPPNSSNNRRVSIGLSKSLIQKTPLTCQSNSSFLSMTNKSFHMYKKTPPFCGCGRRAKLLLTSKPGPNEGRHFFSCPNGGSSMKKGCGYFKWEDDPFVKAPLMSPYCTPLATSNSNFTTRSVPVQRIVKNVNAPLRNAASEPIGIRKTRCIGLSRSNSSGSLSQSKTPSVVSSSTYAKATPSNHKDNLYSTNEPCIITPFITKHQSKINKVT